MKRASAKTNFVSHTGTYTVGLYMSQQNRCANPIYKRRYRKNEWL